MLYFLNTIGMIAPNVYKEFIYGTVNPLKVKISENQNSLSRNENEEGTITISEKNPNRKIPSFGKTFRI